MTDEEKFRFDLTGFLVRPAILERGEVDAIVDQINRIHHNKESLAPEHRAVPGGPASVLIDHPKVLEVLHEIIGPEIRLEHSYSVWREKGQRHGELHGGGPRQADPIFGYRVNNGQIHAGMVRVVFELTDISKKDGGTHFIVGSHKSNFPMHPDHMSLEAGKRSPFSDDLRMPRRQRNLLHGKLMSRRSCVATGDTACGSAKRLCASRNPLAPSTDPARSSVRFTA